MSRRFAVVGKDTGKRFEVEAGCLRTLMARAGDRSRTETVRALREGRSFFMQGEENPDYQTRMHNFSRFNVMIEALRNLNSAEGKDSYGVCIMLSNGTQYFHTSFPPNPGVRRELSKELSNQISNGATILVSKNPEK